MRHYLTTSLKTFVTGAVNDEYYYSTSDFLPSIFGALYRSLETPAATTRGALNMCTQLLSEGSEEEAIYNLVEDRFPTLTPNELRVVYSFALFLFDVTVAEARNVPYKTCPHRNFTYVNVNTGKGISWTVVNM